MRLLEHAPANSGDSPSGAGQSNYSREPMVADPGDIQARVIYSLHLLRLQKPDEADAVFDDVTIFFETLPPGQQAVIAAVKSARGQRELAQAMAATIDKSVLNAGERELIQGLAP